MTQGLLYWKHTPDMTDYHSEGYAGITKRGLEVRNAEHERDAYVRNSLLRVHEMMRLHEGNIKTSIIFEGDYNDCLDYEKELRPRWNMGWNMAIGGGRPGSGWKPNPLWLDNRLWHRHHGEVTIKQEYTIADHERKFLKNQNTNVAKVLLGTAPHSEGWELANAQLAMRVSDRYYNPWSEIFIRQVKNKEIVVHLYKSGFKKFKSDLKFSTSIQCLANGTRFTRAGWELATKEEWLATKERIEFK